jgi:hypothetical protein
LFLRHPHSTHIAYIRFFSAHLLRAVDYEAQRKSKTVRAICGCGDCNDLHSYRNSTTGSMRIARRAGNKHAKIVTAQSDIATLTNVKASVLVT